MEPEDDREDGGTSEDREAILRRRRFLIQSALAGAGIGALLAGCAPKPKPGPCLTVVPPPQPPKPGPCLKVVPPRPRPCLRYLRP